MFKSFKYSFLITMENSHRRNSYMEQLNTYRPTSNVIIIHNKGFKKSKKKDVNNTGQDLWYTNRFIFKMCQDIEEPILVMEDDMEFCNTYLITEIEKIIMTKKMDAFNLGCLPFFSIPIDSTHCRTYCFAYTHAVIYTSDGRKRLIKKKIKRFHDTELSWLMKAYQPLTPTCIQKIEQTKNTNHIGLIYTNLFKADKNPKSFFEHHSLMSVCGGVIPFYTVLVILTYLVYDKVRLISSPGNKMSN